MPYNLIRVLDKLFTNTKRLFLIDSIGALTTAFLLIAILLPFEESFGIPRKILYLLSGIACVFATFSICCYYFINLSWRPFLRTIAVANTLYCILTAIILSVHYDRITIIGFVYFVTEIIIIICLVLIELKAVNIKKKR
ncbi:MAG: hypothetical protein ABIN89_23325 [Chitinophagaceae bacterium]